MNRLLLVATLSTALILAGCAGSETRSGAGDPSPAPESTVPKETTGSAAEGMGNKVAVPGGAYTRVSPEELRGMMRSEEFPLVNVHIPFEGDIPGTDRSIPYDGIGRNLDKLPADKNAKVVLYCRSGSMSTEAAKTLVERGYENVWELEGGMNAWESAGYELKMRE